MDRSAEEKSRGAGDDKLSRGSGAGAESSENASPQGRNASFPLPEVTFSTFILSLNTSALVNLGEFPDPSTGSVNKDLDMSKHAIDTLAMLREKTAGNLDGDEKALLNHILYDLRMKFVKASSAKQ